MTELLISKMRTSAVQKHLHFCHVGIRDVLDTMDSTPMQSVFLCGYRLGEHEWLEAPSPFRALTPQTPLPEELERTCKAQFAIALGFDLDVAINRHTPDEYVVADELTLNYGPVLCAAQGFPWSRIPIDRFGLYILRQWQWDWNSGIRPSHLIDRGSRWIDDFSEIPTKRPPYYPYGYT